MMSKSELDELREENRHLREIVKDVVLRTRISDLADYFVMQHPDYKHMNLDLAAHIHITLDDWLADREMEQ